MAVYLDTSCLLKVFFPEPETVATVALIAREPRAGVPSQHQTAPALRPRARTTAFEDLPGRVPKAGTGIPKLFGDEVEARIRRVAGTRRVWRQHDRDVASQREE